MQDFIVDGRLASGLTYDAYRASMDRKQRAPAPPGDRDARKLHFYVKYNHARSAGVEAAYEPSRALIDAMASIQAPQTWMVITEDWCGDSAFSLPVIARAAGLSERVALRILPRDAHLDVMDRYLTNGARSIPILVAFSDEGEELFRWGPRPAGAVAYRQQLVDEGLEKMQIIGKLTEWYEAGGWRGVDPELAALVASAVRAQEPVMRS